MNANVRKNLCRKNESKSGRWRRTLKGYGARSQEGKLRVLRGVGFASPWPWGLHGKGGKERLLVEGGVVVCGDGGGTQSVVCSQLAGTHARPAATVTTPPPPTHRRCLSRTWHQRLAVHNGQSHDSGLCLSPSTGFYSPRSFTFMPIYLILLKRLL